jgi:flagellar basal-body rod modification protein FlgD
MKELSAALPSGFTDSAIPEAKGKNIMGKDDFMKLLMTQLQNQDPLKPMDSHEFAAQLAQFSSMEQLANINKGIEGLRSGQGDDSKLQAIGMIGKHISAAGRELDLKAGQNATLTHTLDADTKPTKASIFDVTGNLVREIDLSKMEKQAEIVWDGKDNNGVQAAPGKYTFRVQGIGRSGETQESGTELSGRVLGVEMSGKTPMLVVQTPTGTTHVALASVKQVAIETNEGGPQIAKAPEPTKATSALKFEGVPDPAAEEKNINVDTDRFFAQGGMARP